MQLESEGGVAWDHLGCLLSLIHSDLEAIAGD